MRRTFRWLGFAAGSMAIGYGALVTAAWLRYGHASQPGTGEEDPLLDRFMPSFDVAERHHIRIQASPETVLTAAARADAQRAPIVRAIFRTREMFVGATSGPRQPRGLLDEVHALGWRVLAERPGREVVVGAVTQPWQANVVFRGLSPEEFTSFAEPGYVKIIWTLRADPDGAGGSIFRTETRVATTDAGARRKFRWYWAKFSPGIVLIRSVLVRQVKKDAEAVRVSMQPSL